MEAACDVLLALADDEHLMGQQHAEWIGVAPFLEEDLAFCSIAQDELGHAAALYELLALEGVLGDADQLAFRRAPQDYRSCHLVELPCPDWSDALVRHWLYDEAEVLRWDALAGSSWPAVAAVVDRVQREEAYHRRHAEALVARLVDGDAGSRLLDSFQRLVPIADALWEPVAGEQQALADGLVTEPSAQLQARWRGGVDAILGPVEWDALERPAQHGRTTRSGYFPALHARITEVLDLDPTARW
jgi:ring-1,2-phenylacetyl-CoA epoxidase subunit PaaC